MIKVHTPVKMKSYYLSKISNATSSNAKPKSADTLPVRMRISCVKLLSIIKLEKGGSAIRVFISDEDSVQALSKIDTTAKAAVKKYNKKWFNNDMDEETIDALFRNAINNMSNHMTVLISDSHEPNIYVDGQLIDALSQDLLNEANKKDRFVSVDVEAQGLCFYPKKFGVRWFVRNVNVTSEASVQKNTGENWIDKKEIEDVWKDDIKETCMRIDGDITQLEQKIRKLQGLKAELNDEYTTACNMPVANADWDVRLKNLASKSSRYHSGEFT